MELVERGGLLAELQKRLTDVRAGAGRIVLVGGEAGVGKTSLVRAFVADLPADVRVLKGTCDPLTTPTVLGPFHDMGIREPGIAAVLERTERRALFAGLLDVLATTTVMIVDDVHWADEATLDALRFIGRRADSTRGLVVVTFRADEVGLDHPLGVMLGDLATAEAACRIDVAPLTAAGVAALAAGHDLDAADLHRVTAGNPFFVTEVLAGSGDGIPPTVSDAVKARAARLSATAREALEIASVSPGGLEPDLVVALADGVSTGLDECADHGMLALHEGRVAFRHELARAAVEAALAPGRRHTLHLELLTRLEARPAVDPARLAHHADAAGDTAAVLRHAPEAARHAAARGAHREEAQHYQQAVAKSAELTAAERAALLASLAQAEYAFDYDRIPAHLDEEIRLRNAERDRRGEAVARGFLGIVRLLDGDLEGGDAEMRRAIAILEELPPGPELALMYSRVAFAALFWTLDVQEAVAGGVRAIELAERTGSGTALAQALVATGGAETLCGDPERGRPLLDRAHAAAAGLGDSGRTTVVSNVGFVWVEARRYEQAIRCIEEVIEVGSATDNDLDLSRSEADLSRIRFEQGRWADAEQLAEQVLTRSNRTVATSARALMILARLAVRRGTASTAQVAEAIRVTGEVRQVTVEWWGVALQAEAAWIAGRGHEIPAITQAMLSRLLEAGYRWGLGELAFWLSRAGGSQTPPEGVAEPFALQIAGDWRGAAEAWERLGCPYERAEALADGDEPALREALAIFARLGAQPAADRARARLRALGAKRVPARPRASTRAAPAGLTRRQLQVLALLGDGRTNADIARELFITEKTAEHHVSAILRKLGVNTRTEAGAAAAKIGGGEPQT